MPVIDDVQSNPDQRHLPVDQVGVRGVRFPITFEDYFVSGEIERQAGVAMLSLLVNLPHMVKGTHMSRFIEILNEAPVHLSVRTLPDLLHKIMSRLNAECGFFEACFPYFIRKTAPISHAAGLMDYDISLQGCRRHQKTLTLVTVVVPVTSLCPCSKQIADYGAHNQRSHVTVTVEAEPDLELRHLINMIERHASCELYSILKRADEKAVTERAYDNPKFVEDTVRDVARALSQHPGVLSYKVTSENFESIHNHSAFAEINHLSARADLSTFRTSCNASEALFIA